MEGRTGKTDYELALSTEEYESREVVVHDVDSVTEDDVTGVGAMEPSRLQRRKDSAIKVRLRSQGIIDKEKRK